MGFGGLLNLGKFTEPERVRRVLPPKLAPISIFEEVGGRHPEGLGEFTQRSGVRVRSVAAFYSDYSARAYSGRLG